MAKVKQSATIVYTQIFLDAIFTQGLKNAFWHLQIFRHSLIQMVSHFESRHLLSQKHEYTRWERNTLLVLRKLLAHNHANVQKSQPKIPPSVHHTAYSKQNLSFSDSLKRLYPLPYWKHTTDLANGNSTRKPGAYTVDRLASHRKINPLMSSFPEPGI